MGIQMVVPRRGRLNFRSIIRRTTSVPLISSPCIAPISNKTGPSSCDRETMMFISSDERDGSRAMLTLILFSSPGRISVPLKVNAAGIGRSSVRIRIHSWMDFDIKNSKFQLNQSPVSSRQLAAGSRQRKRQDIRKLIHSFLPSPLSLHYPKSHATGQRQTAPQDYPY